MKLLHRWKTHFSLLFSGYALAASRMASAFLLRLIVDPISVGTINSVQVIANITNTLSIGTLYSSNRAIPLMEERNKTECATATLISVLIEGLFIAVATGALAMITLGSRHASPASLLPCILLYSLILRFAMYFESLLQTLCRFRLISLLRLSRVFEPLAAVLGAYLLDVSGYLAFAAIYAGSFLALYWNRLGTPFHVGRQTIRQAVAMLKKPDSYGAWVAAERFVMCLSGMADSLLVTVFLGPSVLAGYYLGVNIRGALQQIASTFIQHGWARAVTTYESAGQDLFARSSFLLKYLALSMALLAAVFLAFDAALIWILPRYRPHFVSCMWATAVAVPYSFTGFLRVSQMLAMKGRRLFLLSLGRFGLFAIAYALLVLSHMHVTALAIGILAYITAAVEFSANYLLTIKHSVIAIVVWLCVCTFPVFIIMLFSLMG